MIKRRKITRAVQVLAAALMSLQLLSCGAGENIELLKSELPEIAEFFSRDGASGMAAEGLHGDTAIALPMSGEAESAPILPSELHVEALPSVYSGGSGGMPDTAGDTDEESRAWYTAVPRFASANVDDVCAALREYGIEPQQTIRKNPAPSGDVYAIEYAGFSDGGSYYINKDRPVRLFVSEEKPALPPAEPDGSNIVYLSYDDGPTESDTARLLDVLDTYGVRATFFVTGNATEKYPESAKLIVDRGHALGCHSMTHVYSEIYASADALKNELLKWEAVMQNAGIEPGCKLFRYPGGSVSNYFDEATREDMNAMLSELGYRVYDWNALTNDAVLFTAPDGTNTYDFLRDTFIETFSARAGSGRSPIIILMHETVPETIDLMPWMIEYLIGEGYTFGVLRDIDSWMFGE